MLHRVAPHDEIQQKQQAIFFSPKQKHPCNKKTKNNLLSKEKETYNIKNKIALYICKPFCHSFPVVQYIIGGVA